MDRFVHRILRSTIASSIGSNNIGKQSTSQHAAPSVQLLVRELQNAKLLYLGEFHSESRIITFHTELIKEWATCLSKSASLPPRIHLVMEHFSIDMQTTLDRYLSAENDDDDNDAFEQLVSSYKNEFGTEGHDLHPYRDLLQFCRSSRSTSCDGLHVQVHGGFIPRNNAARLNKECPDVQSKKLFFEEMSERGYLPKKGDAMYNSLFEDSSTSSSSSKLRGSREHQLLIQSLMDGVDLYSPSEGHTATEEESDTAEEDTPMSRLYQAQLLKDHAMGYRIASLMLDHYETANGPPLFSDRYIVIAGYGHMKHYLGVPDCVNGYLRQEAISHPNEQRRAAAMDLLLSIVRRPLATIDSSNIHPKFGGKGSALIGCQMMYEAYLEESYPPMIDIAKDDDSDEEDGDNDEEDEAEQLKRKLLKELYLQNPTLLDECILKSQEISSPLLHYADGIAGFANPCADYVYVYDEDDDNIVHDTDLDNIPIGDAKDETAEAYERVGKTAGIKGNATRARAIMSQIDYTQEDIEYIGDDDIYNFQGVANPHSVAQIQPGEAVLDIGSGLGIDSFLAMRDCGADTYQPGDDSSNTTSPFVVGIDLAESEVNHATKRASARGYRVPDNIQFITGDIENIDKVYPKFLMNKFDVCISNGAFCLVPDKRKAFSNVYRALASGGRMAISTTTIVSDRLAPEFEWPICMKMFASFESLQPMCESIGFKNVMIIDAESPMEDMEIPNEEDEDDDDAEDNDNSKEQSRFKIHGRYAEQFDFLENMNMDELCKVVTVYGEKP